MQNNRSRCFAELHKMAQLLARSQVHRNQRLGRFRVQCVCIYHKRSRRSLWNDAKTKITWKRQFQDSVASASCYWVAATCTYSNLCMASVFSRCHHLVFNAMCLACMNLLARAMCTNSCSPLLTKTYVPRTARAPPRFCRRERARHVCTRPEQKRAATTSIRGADLTPIPGTPLFWYSLHVCLRWPWFWHASCAAFALRACVWCD